MHPLITRVQEFGTNGPSSCCTEPERPQSTVQTGKDHFLNPGMQQEHGLTSCRPSSPLPGALCNHSHLQSGTALRWCTRLCKAGENQGLESYISKAMRQVARLSSKTHQLRQLGTFEYHGTLIQGNSATCWLVWTGPRVLRHAGVPSKQAPLGANRQSCNVQWLP